MNIFTHISELLAVSGTRGSVKQIIIKDLSGRIAEQLDYLLMIKIVIMIMMMAKWPKCQSQVVPGRLKWIYHKARTPDGFKFVLFQYWIENSLSHLCSLSWFWTLTFIMAFVHKLRIKRYFFKITFQVILSCCKFHKFMNTNKMKISSHVRDNKIPLFVTSLTYAPLKNHPNKFFTKLKLMSNSFRCLNMTTAKCYLNFGKVTQKNLLSDLSHRSWRVYWFFDREKKFAKKKNIEISKQNI